jgi:glutamate formiminotransferase
LLDRTSDASHNRSVLTLAGEAATILEALERAFSVAVAEIDMERHTGEHPRIGAVDVVPFIPLGDTRMSDCIELARAFGARVAERFSVPVYLYGEAATSPSRQRLADVRRGQYEGLKTLIGEAGRGPDFGPAQMHATAGATAVGARPFLIAYNINLDTRNLELAKRIARRIRESSGGLPKVQANGFWIEELGCAQVSMNLLDFRTTPIWLVWEAVLADAADDRVDVIESELIGLAPLAALLDVADHAGVAPDLSVGERLTRVAQFLRLQDFSPMQALELRLDAARGK